MTAKPEYQNDVKALGQVLEALAKLDAATQRWVLNTAANRLNVPMTPGTAAPGTNVATSGPAIAAGTGGGMSPKEFLRIKAPKADVDRVACLAFYLTHERHTAAYAARELSAINTEAAGPRFNMSRAVDNAAKQSAYLASAGKGKKQITTHGEDVVNALPDYDKVKSILSAGKAKPRRRRAKKNAA